jgi:hypothetical protein
MLTNVVCDVARTGQFAAEGASSSWTVASTTPASPTEPPLEPDEPPDPLEPLLPLDPEDPEDPAEPDELPSCVLFDEGWDVQL